jgi:hypothetical protein
MGTRRDSSGSDWPLDRAPRGNRSSNAGRPIPLLRVRFDRDGRITPTPRALGPTDTNDAWWESVLHDHRARTVDPRRHSDRLGTIGGGTITVACNRCRLRKAFAVDTLLEQYGADYMLRYLRFDLVNCGRSARHCAVLYD